jgi:hypothetical protein
MNSNSIKNYSTIIYLLSSSIIFFSIPGGYAVKIIAVMMTISLEHILMYTTYKGKSVLHWGIHIFHYLIRRKFYGK